MLPYLVILFFLASFSFLEMFKLDKQQKCCLFSFSFLILLLFSGLRYDVGMDYSAYEDIYQESSGKLNLEIKEIGWRYFFYWFQDIGLPFSVVIFLISLFTLSAAFAFIKKYSPYPFLSILIFFCFAQYYTYTFNVMRQCLAGYIFLSSLEYIQRRCLAKYIIVVGFAAFFIHTSAIILFPLYFLLHRSYSLYLKVGLIIVVLFFAKFLIILIASSETYRIYLAFEQYAAEVSVTSYLLIAISSFFLIMEVFVKNKTSQDNMLLNISYLSLLFFLVVCFFSGTPLVLVFLRLAYYFTPVLIVLLPLFVKRFFSVKTRYIVVSVIAMIYMSIFCYTLIIGGEKSKLIPYKTIFD